MKKNKVFICILLLVLIILSVNGWYKNKTNTQIIIKTVVEMDREKNRVLTNNEAPNYDIYVDNPKLKEYYELRDKYNALWSIKNNSNIKKSIVGYSDVKGLVLFNRCFILYTAQNNIIDASDPVRSEVVYYKRFVILKAKDYRWFITKDISKIEDNIKLSEIFDKSYLEKKIEDYDNKINDISK